MRPISRVIGLGIIFCAVSGCALKTAPSGFLDDYSNLRESKERNRLYVSPVPTDQEYTYTRLMIDPVIVQFHPDARGTEVDPQKLQEWRLYLESRISKVFGETYVLTEKPGPKVLRLKAAITDVVPNTPLLNIAPHHTLASGVGLGGAAVEAVFVDGQTGERVLALRYGRKGLRRRYFKGWSKWGHTEDVLNEWVDILYEQINAVNPVAMPDQGTE
jgi:hypothetical protein